MTKRKTKQKGRENKKIGSKFPTFQEKKLTIEPIFFVVCFVYSTDFHYVSLRSAANESKKTIVKRKLSASKHTDEEDRKNWFYDGCYVFS